MYKEMIGKKSSRVKNIVERGMVKRFAASIGDSHPIYMDEEVGKKSRYGANIAPPTFPRTFDYGTVEGLHLPSKGLIHGEQIYHYVRPLLVGEEIYCYTEVKDYYDKTGKNGLMGFLVTKRYGEDLKGNLIFTEESIVIINEAVREALKV
ncbi:MaoC family dehydratase N-terminal domain-containing protein [Oceanobacillus sp. J11TS1]|uniref:MaoC family dehydratase N-terminal domain-containing protein n=1 Tax=Oceanobacillus sp. J11TS1 TaxID=2807191 RepID=UPI001AFED0FF|nr:MaoC family dehydratase N-terminal domain-containing protein [Oceanobacillus sp. J11TS1]GIO22554.1 dehydratase [Oceanobacillus sp. J11TS1]